MKMYLIRYLNPANHDPLRIIKAEKNSVKKVNFKDLKFPVKIRDIYKIENKRIPPELVFLAMKIKKNIQSI